MSKRTMTVFGGTGFLGTRVVRWALSRGWNVRVAARHSHPGLYETGVESIAADVRNPEQVEQALGGASAVVNAVGLYVQSRGETFQSVHVEAAGRMARASESAGARHVHVSGIGVDLESSSPYVRARACGEQAVRRSNSDAVVLRPGVLFGEGDAFLSVVTMLVERLPVIPLFGRGDCRLQPVHVDDVARAVVAAVEREDARAGIFELGGPDVWTWRRLLEAQSRRLGRRRWLLPVPFPLWHLLAVLASSLPAPPITRDQIELLRHDNVVRSNSTFESLGIESGTLAGIFDGVEPAAGT